VPFYANVNHAFLIVSVVGFVVMFGGVVFAITAPRAVKGGDRSPSDSDAQRQKRGKSSGGFTSRMEDRFRRRFDE
jgi:hypothetical protein